MPIDTATPPAPYRPKHDLVASDEMLRALYLGLDHLRARLRKAQQERVRHSAAHVAIASANVPDVNADDDSEPSDDPNRSPRWYFMPEELAAASS